MFSAPTICTNKHVCLAMWFCRNSVDPLYAKIADEWMKQIIADFGTDHWYQLDGYFNGGTAPWMDNTLNAVGAGKHEFSNPPATSSYPTCTFLSPHLPPKNPRKCQARGTINSQPIFLILFWFAFPFPDLSTVLVESS